MSVTTTPKGQALTPAIGGLYNWKDQPERGLSINLNHSDYYTVIEPPKDTK